MNQKIKWEVLSPVEEKRVCGLSAEKAERIVRAFIGGSTKTEIARVFGVSRKVVSEVIQMARAVADHNAPIFTAPTPIFRKPLLLT